MTTEDNANDPVLDTTLAGAIGESLVATPADPDRVRRLRARVMEQIGDDTGRPSLFDTIRAGEGEWIEVMPNVEKKRLKIDDKTGIESYLLRLQPGAEAPAHVHESDELCYVVEGDLAFGDIRLEAGDYHFARKGSEHGAVSTVNGALLFLQEGV